MATSEEIWPQWPSDAKPQRMVNVDVACKADELFLLLYGLQSPYVSKSQQQLGNKDYSETFWTSETELVAGKKGSQPKTPLKPSSYKGLARKTSCSGSGMGIKYINTELQRCLEASEGGPFEVDVVVQTTATYGDRFRPILKHRVVGAGQASCTYTVDYTLVYVTNTNAFLKKAIERGATNGVTKNFDVLVDILGSFKTVRRIGEGKEPAVTEMEGEKPRQGEGPCSLILPWWSPRVGEQSIQLMEIPASWVMSKVGVRATAVGRASSLAVIFASSLLLVVLGSMLFLLQASLASCKVSTGLAARACRLVLHSLDVPASLRQVLTSGTLLLLANAALAVLSSRLLESLLAARLRRTSAAASEADHPSSGIRYEGFERSLESAAANIAEGEGKLKKRAAVPASSQASARSKGMQFRDNLRLSFKNLIDPIARHPIARPKQAAKVGGVEGPSSQTPSPASPTSLLPAPASPAENGSEAAREVGARPNLTTALSDDSASVVLSDEDDARSQLGMTSKRLSASSGFREYINPGGLLDKTETMFAQWSGANKIQRVTPAQPIPQGRLKGAQADYEAQAEASALSPSAMELADLSSRDPEEVSGEPVEEEVFENERYQPFRGWGHQWPGHFLPTDRVGHWSAGSLPQSPMLDHTSFDAVAPRLKKGWEWVEEDWQIDMKGLLEIGVDEEGWSYAVDFPWIQWPPAPGSGKFRKVRDYVRRRRWFRTRRFAGIPLQDSPSRRLPSTSASSMTSLLTEALATKPSEDENAAPLTLPRSSADRDSLEKVVPPRPKAEQHREQDAPQDAPSSANAPSAAAQTRSPVALQKQMEESKGSGESLSGGRSRSPVQAESDNAASLLREDSFKGLASKMSDRMSSMFAAASSSLRPSPTKADRSSQPVLVRESAPVPGNPLKETARRTGSETLDRACSAGDLATFFGIRPEEKPTTHAPHERDQSAADAQEEPSAVRDTLTPLDTTAASANSRLSTDEERHAAAERLAEPSTGATSRAAENINGAADAALEGRADATPSSGSKHPAEPFGTGSRAVKLGSEASKGCILPEAGGSALEVQEPSPGSAPQESAKAAAGDAEMPAQQPVRSVPGTNPSPFSKGGLADLEERAAGGAESSEVDMPLSNQRLGGSLPVGTESKPEGERMPRAMSADEASHVIERAREAVEQVQRELQAMLPLMNAKRQNGQQTRPGQA